MVKTIKRITTSLLCIVFSLTLSLSTLFANHNTIYANAASNEETIFSFVTNEMGMNSAAGCAVLANVYAESSFRPDLWGDGGTSYGICQWHNSRFTRLKTYCSNNGFDYTSLNGQLHYLDHELKNYYPSVYNELANVANTPEGAYAAASYWCINFEVPADRYNKAVDRGNMAMYTYWPKYNDQPFTAPTVNTNKSSYIPGSDIDINWNYVAGATGYWIDIYKDGEGIVSSNLGNVKSYTIKNAESAEYGVFVTAFKETGEWQSACSDCCRFSVRDINAPVVYTNYEYYAPNAEVDIMWNLVDGATGYWIDIYCDGESVLSKHLNDANCSKYTYQCTKGKYGVFVTAYSENGGWSSACSNCYNFYVQDVGFPKPTTNSNCYTPGSNVVVSWEKVDSASGYWMDVWKDGEHISTENIGNVLSYTVPDVKLGNYGVIVTAYNDRGGWTNAIAEAVNFNVIEPPSKPELNMTIRGASVLLEWNECDNTDYYGIRINNLDSEASNLYKEPYEGCEFTTSLAPGRYYANIASVQKNGFFTFSEDVYFEIKEAIEGDCNGDGEFSVSDVVLLQKWLLAVPDTHFANWKAANLCEDDRLDVFDLCFMKRKLIYG